MSYTKALEPNLTFTINPPTTGAGTGDTFAFLTVPTGMAGEIVGAQIINGATLAANGTNYTTLTVQKGATVMATVDSSASAFTADTPRSFTLSTTTANRRFTAGDVLQVVKTESGTGGAITAPVTVTILLAAVYNHGAE